MASIVQLPEIITGTVNLYPNQRPMIVRDNLATVTTAGYLNSANLAGFPISQLDVINMFYNYVSPASPGTYGVFTVSISSGVITLTEHKTAGGVTATLPTSVNNMAVFSDTTGDIMQNTVAVPGVARNLGNVQAGQSGTAGALISYPNTALSGNLILQATNNAGNTSTTIQNISMAQASVISIPDPSNAAARFMIGATNTPFVSGNIPMASGTGGLFVDSGVTATSVSTVLTTTVTLSASQVTGMYGAPVQILAANAGASYIPISLTLTVASSGHTAFANGGEVQLQWANTVHAGGTNACAATIPAATINAAANTNYSVGANVGGNITGAGDIGLYLTNATGAFTGGTGSTLVVQVTYLVCPILT